MSKATEETYATAVGRSMWRMAKRRAIAALAPHTEPSALTRASFPGAPESKAQLLAGSSLQGRDAPPLEPTTLREFLQRLGEELEPVDQRPHGS